MGRYLSSIFRDDGNIQVFYSSVSCIGYIFLRIWLFYLNLFGHNILLTLASSEVVSPVSIPVLVNWVYSKVFEWSCRNVSILSFFKRNQIFTFLFSIMYFFNLNNFWSSLSSTFCSEFPLLFLSWPLGAD